MVIFEAEVRDISTQGLGVIDHPDGKVFFVHGVWPGDVGQFFIRSSKKNYGFAQLEKLIQPSPNRVKPVCSHQGTTPGKCGGCPWMIASYPSQLKHKENSVRNHLERHSLLSPKTHIHAIKGSEKNLGYRNRAQFKTDGDAIGFVSSETNQLAPIKDCLVLNDKTKAILHQIRETLPRSDWKPEKGRLWNTLEIDDDDIDLSQITPNAKRPFRQGNTAQNQKMRNWLHQKLNAHNRNQTVLELFSGNGNFTEVISDLDFHNITSIEGARSEAARLSDRKLPNVKVGIFDLLNRNSWKMITQLCRAPEILILDPPRDGFLRITEFIKNFPDLKTVYYISCNLNSFSRDAKALLNSGWHLDTVQPLDLFPHTPHVELLTRFSR